MRIGKNGFTLAEIMVVLTVIGVLTAILLPVAINSAPDENVLKFKKANAILGNVIRELVNSDKYYLDGDLGTKPDGSSVLDTSYFCNTFADIISTKSADCNEITLRSYPGSIAEDWYINGTISNSVEEEFDKYCTSYLDNINSIISADNIVFYEPLPGNPFGFDPKEDNYYRVWDKQGTDTSNYTDGFYYLYKPFCIDVDGIGIGEDPFGYGIRVDGKIYPGARAKEWVDKSIQRDD